MTREHVDILIGKMAGTPGAGIVLLKRLRSLLRYAMAQRQTENKSGKLVREELANDQNEFENS